MRRSTEKANGPSFGLNSHIVTRRPKGSAAKDRSVLIDIDIRGNPPEGRPKKWRKVAYGGMQPAYDDNYTDDSFLEDMVMNANVVKRDMVKVMLDSVAISQYLSIVALVGVVWTYTLQSSLDRKTVLLMDCGLIMSGFLILLLTEKMISVSLLIHYLLSVSFFATGLYMLAPVYKTLTRSISSDSIWAVAVGLLIVHLFLHDYSQCTVRATGTWRNPTLTSCISLNASIVASVFITSRLPSWGDVFVMVLFSLLVFLFAPLVTYCIKKCSCLLHLLFSALLMFCSLALVYRLHTVLLRYAVRTIGFHYRGLSLLADKDTGGQVRD